MKAKIININKSKDLPSEQLTLEQCQQMFKAEAHGYSDEELIQMKDFLFKLAKIYYEFYRATGKQSAKVISLNNQPYGTEKSHHICKSKHRRAS